MGRRTRNAQAIRVAELLETRVHLSGVSFVGSRVFEAGQYLMGMAGGDFNCDGKADLAVATNGAVAVLLGNGDGTFERTQVVNQYQHLAAIVTGDLNGDGKVDLAVADDHWGNYGSVSVLLGDGNGSFAHTASANVGRDPLTIALGDFNGDGNVDVATVNGYVGTASVVSGNGDGSLGVSAETSVGNVPRSLAVADFNADGKSDLAVTRYDGITLLMSRSDGGMQQTSIALPGHAVSVAAHDIDHDGRSDLELSASDHTIGVCLGNGDGTFQSMIVSDVSGPCERFVVDDVTGDGKEDLVGQADGMTLAVLAGDGGGHFTRIPGEVKATGPEAIVPGDYNGDGICDLAVANYGETVTVILGKGGGTFVSRTDYAAGTTANDVECADLDRDGKADLVVADADGNAVRVVMGAGDGTFQVGSEYSTASKPIALATGDFNEDGNIDVATANNLGGSVSILLGNGDGTLQAREDYPVGDWPGAIAVGDFNSDGALDLIVGVGLDTLSILPGNGDGTFGAARRCGCGWEARAIAVADLNGDAISDVAVANGAFGAQTVSVLLGRGDGTFAGQAEYPTGPVGGGLVIADLNGDGRNDLVVLNNYNSTMSILLGNGDGSFAAAATRPVVYAPRSVTAADFNHDGKIDIAVTSQTGNLVCIYLGNGDGTFGREVRYGLGPTPCAASVGDFNGDGWDDMAFAQSATGTVGILLGVPDGISLSATSVGENQPSGTVVGLLRVSNAGPMTNFVLVPGDGANDNDLFEIVSSQLQTRAMFDYETQSSYSIRVRATDQAGSFFEKAFTIRLSDVNEAPTNITLSSNTIAENQPAGTAAGMLSTIDPDAGDTSTYLLVSGMGDDDNTSFTINAGQLLTAAPLDYELKNTYSIRVRTTDRDGLFLEKTLTISVSNLNETPTDIALSSASVLEHQPAGTVVGTLFSADPDAGDRFTYTLVSGAGSTDNASFTIIANQLQTAATFDFEADKGSYSICIRSTDAGGLYVEKAFTITLSNVNENPSDLTLSNTSVAENQLGGTVVGTLTTTDPDIADSFTYTLVDGAGGEGGEDNADFSISGNRLLAAGSFNYESRSSYNICIRSTDAGGLFFEKAYTITVTNVNEAPANLALSSGSVAENQPVGTIVGNLSSSDPDAADTCTYSLVAGSDDNASFTISGNQLKTATAFDFEARNSYSIRIRATDAGGLYAEKAFTVTVSNINETPTDVALINTSLRENQPAGTLVGTLSSADPDANDAFTYTLVDGAGEGGEDNASFTLSGNRLLSAASFDYEAKDSYLIRLRSTDAGGLYVEKAFAVTVSNINETPTDVALINTSLRENQPAGTVVGTLWCSDPDAGDTFTYTLIDGSGGDDNASFTISGYSLLATSSFDHEQKDSYSIRVRGRDAGGLYCEKVFAISVGDVNEAPLNLALSSITVQENLPSGTVVGVFLPVDPDAEDSFTYTLVDGSGSQDNALFAIEAGQLTAAKRFNYEFRTDYSVRVQVTDSGGLSYQKALDIQISDDPTDYRGAFGRTGGKKAIKLTLADTDGDLVTFKLSGTGTGKVYGFENSFEDLSLTASDPNSAVTITVEKPKKHPVGDKLMTLGNITSDGPIKCINAPAAILSGLVQLNTLDITAPRAKASLKLRQITDSDIRLQNLPVSSIAVKGDLSGTRLVTDSSIKTLKAATLLDSDILVGMATGSAEDCAYSPADFANSTAWLGNLKISGRKLPSKAPHPADVSNSHISAPSIGTLTLMNVVDTSDPMVHVATDLGTLKITQSKLTNQPMFPPGTWKTPGTRPTIWEVLG